MSKVLVLMHEALIPPPVEDEELVDWDKVPWASEYDVLTTLRLRGHDTLAVGVLSDLSLIRKKWEGENPSILFNLLEEFDGEAIFDQNVVSYLELLRIPYTGCNPRGLMLARDKALAKKILTYHRIKTPRFIVLPRNKKRIRPKNLEFPLIVKCLNEESSTALSKASVVTSDEKLSERVEFLHSLGFDVIAEQFIEGREFYMSVIGNYRLETFPGRELVFAKSDSPEKEFYSARAKFNYKYRERHGITTESYTENDELAKKLSDVSKKTYRALHLNGYARVDLRVTPNNDVYVIEANPNPDISEFDDFSLSALEAGVSYEELLEKIITLGRSWNPTSVQK